MKTLTEPLQELIASSPFLILHFGSASCPPCQAIHKRLDAWLLGHKEEGALGRYIPLEENRELAAQMGVLTVPTVMATREGKLIARESGYFSLDLLLKNIERIWEMEK